MIRTPKVLLSRWPDGLIASLRFQAQDIPTKVANFLFKKEIEERNQRIRKLDMIEEKWK